MERADSFEILVATLQKEKNEISDFIHEVEEAARNGKSTGDSPDIVFNKILSLCNDFKTATGGPGSLEETALGYWNRLSSVVSGAITQKMKLETHTEKEHGNSSSGAIRKNSKTKKKSQYVKLNLQTMRKTRSQTHDDSVDQSFFLKEEYFHQCLTPKKVSSNLDVQQKNESNQSQGSAQKEKISTAKVAEEEIQGKLVKKDTGNRRAVKTASLSSNQIPSGSANIQNPARSTGNLVSETSLSNLPSQGTFQNTMAWVNNSIHMTTYSDARNWDPVHENAFPNLTSQSTRIENAPVLHNLLAVPYEGQQNYNYYNQQNIYGGANPFDNMGGMQTNNSNQQYNAGQMQTQHYQDFGNTYPGYNTQY